MPTPDQLEAIGRLTATALIAAGLLALFLDFVRPTKSVKEREAQREQQWAEERARYERVETRLLGERDAAIALAQSYGDQFERALDIIEAKSP